VADSTELSLEDLIADEEMVITVSHEGYVKSQPLATYRMQTRGGRGLQRRYLRAAGRVVDHAWRMAVGADLALPEVAGHRPRSLRAVNAYLARLQCAAERDGVVAEAFLRVIGMLEPPQHVFRPAIALRVLRGGGL
jgi:hypothetical protein